MFQRVRWYTPCGHIMHVHFEIQTSLVGGNWKRDQIRLFSMTSRVPVATPTRRCFRFGPYRRPGTHLDSRLSLLALEPCPLAAVNRPIACGILRRRRRIRLYVGVVAHRSTRGFKDRPLPNWSNRNQLVRIFPRLLLCSRLYPHRTQRHRTLFQAVRSQSINISPAWCRFPPAAYFWNAE